MALNRIAWSIVPVAAVAVAKWEVQKWEVQTTTSQIDLIELLVDLVKEMQPWEPGEEQ